MKVRNLLLSAIAIFAMASHSPLCADNMATMSINSATGEVTLTPRWEIGGNLGGFHFMAQDLSLGGGPTQFYSLKNSAIPPGGDITAFTIYQPGSGAATAHADIGSKLRPNSYSALTSADPDLGFGSVQFYFIHRKDDGDYFSHLVPGSGTASAVTDLKPMSQPGGPSTGGASGYFGLTFSADDLGFGANLFYYLRTDPVTGFGILGSLVPALAGTSTDRNNLGIAGYEALAYTTTDVGYGSDQFYYHRRDPITGFTILGSASVTTGRGEDIANLGSVFSTLTFVPGDVSFGTNLFYTTGAVNPTWQSVSFAAIADRNLLDGPFPVTPTASSGLPLVLTVVTGSTATATISGPVGGVFTVTPTSEGRLILQATQMGQDDLIDFEYNMLRQSFNVGPGAYLPPGVFPDGSDGTGPGVPPGSGGPGPGVPPGSGGNGPGSNIALLADFNRDGFTDLVMRKSRSGVVMVMQMRGATVVRKRVIARKVPNSMQIVAVGDFNGNGRSDILWRDRKTNRLSVWYMRGLRMRNDREIRTRYSPSKKILAAGDINRDGRTDILWQKSNGAVGVFLAGGKRGFKNRFIGSRPADDVLVGAGDFTRDGNVDILFKNSNTGVLSLWVMNRRVIASNRVLATSTTGGRIEGTGEFNGDGHIDILVRNGREISAWFMNGDQVVGSDVILRRPASMKIQN